MLESTEDNASPFETRFRAGLRILVTLGSIGTLLIFMASHLGRYSFLCELISNFQLYILILLLVSLLLLAWMKFKRMFWVLAAASIWSASMVLSSYIPRSQPSEGPQIVRVMSYNVLGTNPNHLSALKVIRNADPDILVIVEYTQGWHQVLEILAETYPHRVQEPRWHGFGIAIFSKYDIEDHSVIQLAGERTDNPAIISQIWIGEDLLRVAAIHSISPVNVERMSVRNQQFEELAGHLEPNGMATLLAGDLNCTTWSPFLRDLMRAAELFDSRRGFGYQASWSALNWPLKIPIDHQLISKQVHVHSRVVLDNSGGSDHFPIYCDISIAPQE